MSKEIPIPDTKECVHSHCGVWACEPKAFDLMYQRVMNGSMPMINSSELAEKKSTPPKYETINGIAVIPLVGTSQKAESKYSDSFSTVSTRRMIRHAVADDSIRGIMLFETSPGGMFSGQNELGIEIAKANKVKPVRAYGEDVVASAAMWSASQAGYFSCNPTCLVGSIGTYSVVSDSSGAAEKAGIKVHVIATGDYKGAGVAGTKITDKQLEEMNKITTSINEFFLNAVSVGRNINMTVLKTIADGRCFIADEAVKLGLVDKVESWDDAMMNFAESIEDAEINELEPKERVIMENEQLNQFATIFGDASAMGYLKAGMSFEDAATKHIATLNGQISAMKAESITATEALATANASIKTLKTDTPLPADNATPPKSKSSEGDEDPIQAWDDAMSANVAAGMSVDESTDSIRSQTPAIYEAFVNAYNAGA